jgi:multisubunit Na+/H+ antiporter MnhF subunit
VDDAMAWVAVAEIAIVSLLLARLALGPTVSDRVVALNTISVQATLALFAYSAFVGRSFYLDVALWLASFSYLGTIVWARYLERGFL